MKFNTLDSIWDCIRLDLLCLSIFMQNAQLCQVSNVRLSFFTWLNSIPVCNTFYYPLWPLFCFLLAIETSTAITKRVRYFFNSDFIYFGYVLSAGVASYHRSFSRCLKKLCVFLQGDSAMCYLCQWLHVGPLVSFSLSKITVFHIFCKKHSYWKILLLVPFMQIPI